MADVAAEDPAGDGQIVTDAKTPRSSGNDPQILKVVPDFIEGAEGAPEV